MSTPSEVARAKPGGVRTGTSVAVAFAVHLAILLFVPEFRASLRSLAPTTADFVEVEPEPPPPPPVVTPPPARERPEPNPNDPPPPADAPPPPLDQAAEALPDILEAPEIELGNASFTMPDSTGTPTGPIQSGTVTGTNAQGSAVGSPEGELGGTGPVRDADLSSRAAAPSNMNEILNRHYPDAARQQGVEGTVSVTIEVRADGSIGQVRVGRESMAGFGFGTSCRTAVREMHFTPARDLSGTPVTSHLPLRCRFEISH